MFEAYKVGITIALTNQISRGLMLVQRDLAKTDARAVALKNTLRQIEKLAVGGAIAGGIGYAGLKAIGAAVKPAEEYVHQLELAKSAGMSQLEIARATSAAWKTTGDVMTTTAADNLKSLRELRMVFGDTGHAIEFLPQMQKIQSVLDSVLHGAGGVHAKDVAFTAAKALELRGASMDPKTFQAQADLIVKGVIASGGRFTPQMLLQAQKYAGIGGTGYSNDFQYGILPSLVQELGGSQTGNSLTSMYRAVVGGRIDKKALGVWQSLGLLDSVTGVTGETAMVQAKNAKLFQQDPFAYMQFLQSQFAAKGITDPAAQQQMIERMFSNRVAARMANVMAMQGPRLQKDFNLIGQAGTTGEYDRLINADPVMARQAAAAQWENLKTVIGLQVIPVLIPAIKSLADGLHGLSEWARAYPTITKTLTLAFVGLSGAMLFSGAVLTLKAAFLGVNAVIGLAGGGGVLGRVGALALALGPLGLAIAGVAAAAAGVLTYHKEIANWIDQHSWGRAAGDGLLALTEGGLKGRKAPWLDQTVAPRGGDKNITVNTAVNLDGRKVADAVSTHQHAAMSRAPASAGMFDGRRDYSPSGSSAAW